MSIAFLVIGLLVAFGGLGSYIYFLSDYIRDEEILTFSKKLLLKWGVSLVGFAIGCAFLSAAVNTWGGSDGWNMSSGHCAMAVSGNLFFTFFFALLWGAFALNFYKKGLKKEYYKLIRILLYGSIPLSLIFFLLAAEGVAPYLSYPLYNGITIGGSEGPFAFTTIKSTSSGGLHVAFYALAILTGVIVVYFICDHEFYKRYNEHGLLLPIAVIGFVCGILGARIWYVVGNWTRDGFDQNPLRMFAIWEGGLTIIGGAVFGIIGGVITFFCSKKMNKSDLRWGLDVIIPTILIAQACGRWGNFFNCEVHGNVVNLSEGWGWLPTWIFRNMQYSSETATLTGEQLYVPLFLIEALINLAGYFIIRFGILTPLKKWIAPGDGAGLYFIWYGVVRIIMEPMRDSSFNMGETGNFSIWGSLAYIFIGIGIIAAFEIWHYIERRKAKTDAGV